MIELRGIEKTYTGGAVETPVLKDVSFGVEKGEYVAVMGTSGTGKTTLMNILGCLDRPTGGTYTLDGAEVAALDDDELSRLRGRKLGFVFQQFHLLERASALRNVMLPFIYSDDYPSDARERAERALEAVGLADRKAYGPGELSGGQQQRVAIARALVTDPQVILADEPTGNLDRRSGLEVLAIFGRLHAEGRTLVVVTHDEAVASHARRVLTLAGGTIESDRRVERPADAGAELEALARKGNGGGPAEEGGVE
jgi:ABC-type lipoprotein export system ATPase subunit